MKGYLIAAVLFVGAAWPLAALSTSSEIFMWLHGLGMGIFLATALSPRTGGTDAD